MAVRLTVIFFAAISAWPQASSVTRVYDVNGRPVPSVSTSDSRAGSYELTRNLNGRKVPIEAVEERVISNTGSVKIVERGVKRYDPDGRLVTPERIRVEERNEPDGSTRTLTIVSRADMTGTFQVTERASTTTRMNGNRVESSTTIERPGQTGSLEVKERLDRLSLKTGDRTTEIVTRFEKDANGKLGETAKRTREATTANGNTNENVAEYDTANGSLRMARQMTSRIDPTGSREVTVYIPNVEGKMQLFQQQTVERTKTNSGTVELTTVRTALPSDPNKLGPARKVEETVCTGQCGQ